MVRVARGGMSKLWSFATAERVKCSEKMSRSANSLKHKALAVAQCWTDGAFMAPFVALLGDFRGKVVSALWQLWKPRNDLVVI